MTKVLQQLLSFREARDWKQFHSPENIAKSIVLEAAEVLEVFQWKKSATLTKNEKKQLAEEMADVYNWLQLLAHDLDIDLETEALKKIKKNQEKYPVEKSRGKAKKYTEL
ncbi:MAG: nucleotide pyrophosphohydrolase [Patescibacteria group bacterium]